MKNQNLFLLYAIAVLFAPKISIGEGIYDLRNSEKKLCEIQEIDGGLAVFRNGKLYSEIRKDETESSISGDIRDYVKYGDCVVRPGSCKVVKKGNESAVFRNGKRVGHYWESSWGWAYLDIEDYRTIGYCKYKPKPSPGPGTSEELCEIQMIQEGVYKGAFAVFRNGDMISEPRIDSDELYKHDVININRDLLDLVSNQKCSVEPKPCNTVREDEGWALLRSGTRVSGYWVVDTFAERVLRDYKKIDYCEMDESDIPPAPPKVKPGDCLSAWFVADRNRRWYEIDHLSLFSSVFYVTNRTSPLYKEKPNHPRYFRDLNAKVRSKIAKLNGWPQPTQKGLKNSEDELGEVLQNLLDGGKLCKVNPYPWTFHNPWIEALSAEEALQVIYSEIQENYKQQQP